MVFSMIHVVPDAEAAAIAAARLAGTILRERVERTDGPVCFVLSGGSSPRGMYGRLAEPERARVPWQRIHVLWGDERCVPPDDPCSNYGMALQTGLLALPFAAIHRMPGELPPEEGARRYEEELRALLPADGFPRLDLVVLGLGGDAHVASLVPGSAVLGERERWVAATELYQGTRRLTLTLPLLASARCLLFLVTGRAKADAVRSLLAPGVGDRPPLQEGLPLPGRMLLDTIAAGERVWGGDEEGHTTATWIIDEAAASLLPPPARLDEEPRPPVGYGQEDQTRGREGA